MGRLGTRVGIWAVAAAGLLALAPRPAHADCTSSVFFGNFQGINAVRLELSDPAAFWLAYIYQDPSINQGQVPIQMVAASLEPGTVQIFGDWAGGLGMQGCPLECAICTLPGQAVLREDTVQVTVLGDSQGTTFVLSSAVENVFDFDRTNPAGGILAVTNLRPRVVQSQGDGSQVYLSLAWEDLRLNLDSGAVSAVSVLRAYRILHRAYRGDQLLLEEVIPDLDGSSVDSRATVSLPPDAECPDSAPLHSFQLLVDLKGKDAQPAGTFRGPPSQPVHVTPGRGECSYSDADGDHHCRACCEQMDPDAPPILCFGDCNDANPDVHSGAPELCNGVDDDCDRSVDEDDSGTDADGDQVPGACDNCSTAFNPPQSDLDEDREGDACDLNDGSVQFVRAAVDGVSWQREEGKDWYNLYRGDLGVLRRTGEYTQLPSPEGAIGAAAAARYCMLPEASQADDFVPEPGQAVFYLVTGSVGGVEDSLGQNSAGTERPNTAPCD